MRPWPLDLDVFNPWPLSSCVWQVSEGDAERVREPWLGDPTRALVTGVMGLLLPPVRLSVHPAASRGPRVLRSLRFQPSPENSTAGKTVSLILMSFNKYKYLFCFITKCFYNNFVSFPLTCAIVKLSKFIHFWVSRFEYLRNLHNLQLRTTPMHSLLQIYLSVVM